MSDDTIDYVAHAMYSVQCRQRGSLGVRWLCMRADLKEVWREKAREAVRDWLASEKAAEVRRGEDPKAFFTRPAR